MPRPANFYGATTERPREAWPTFPRRSFTTTMFTMPLDAAAVHWLNSNPAPLSPKQIYFSKRLPSAIGGTVEVGGYLYGTNSQGLMCVEFKTGKVKWQDRSVGAGSILYADGCLYVHGEDNNTVALVEANSEGYHKKGEFTPPKTPNHAGRAPKAWAYPVIANGHLFIRDLDHLWCYDLHQ